MSEDSRDYTTLRNACEVVDMTVELEAYENLLRVRNFYDNAAKAVIRSRIAQNCGFDDEFVQVTCEERVPMDFSTQTPSG